MELALAPSADHGDPTRSASPFRGFADVWRIEDRTVTNGANTPFRRLIDQREPVCAVVMSRLWTGGMDVYHAQMAVEDARRAHFRHIVVLSMLDAAACGSQPISTVLQRLNLMAKMNAVAVPDAELVKELALAHDLGRHVRPPGLVNAYLVFEHGDLVRSWRAKSLEPDQYHAHGNAILRPTSA